MSPYRDAAGYLTIGYGHKIADPAKWRGNITEQEADSLLACDVICAEGEVAKYVTVPLTQGQFDALVDAVFNLGAGSKGHKDGIFVLSYGQPSTLRSLLNSGDYAGAREQLLRWDHADGKVLSGLTTRRRAEYELWGKEVA